jgi:hypothetical protein
VHAAPENPVGVPREVVALMGEVIVQAWVDAFQSSATGERFSGTVLPVLLPAPTAMQVTGVVAVSQPPMPMASY